MDGLMAQIEAVFYLIENQNLITTERLEKVKEIISKEMKEQKDRSYKMGMKRAVYLLNADIEAKFGHLV
jgi:hypothetical protein